MSIVKTLSHNYLLGFKNLPILAQSVWSSTNPYKLINRSRIFGLEVKKPYADFMMIADIKHNIYKYDKFISDSHISSHLRIAGKLHGEALDINELAVLSSSNNRNNFYVHYNLDFGKPNFSSTSFTQNFSENDAKLVADNFWVYLKNSDLVRVRDLEELLIEAVPDIRVLD